MFQISTTNPTLCAAVSFATVWNGWYLNQQLLDCKFDALPLCHRNMLYAYV